MKDSKVDDKKGAKNYSDFEKEYDSPPYPPGLFKVEIADDKQHLKFTFRSAAGYGRAKPATFRAYLASSTYLGSEGLNSQDTISALFKASILVGSIDGKPGTPSTFLNRDFIGADGYFFGTAVSALGQESTPSAPVYNPTKIVEMNSADSVIPGDVTDCQATWQPILQSNGTTVLSVTVTARPPVDATSFRGKVKVDIPGTAVTWRSGDFFHSDWVGQKIRIAGTPYEIASITDSTHLTLATQCFSIGDNFSYDFGTGSFDGFQIYIQNYLNSDPTFESYEEGPFFKNPIEPSASGLITGSFTLNPDAPPVYSVGTVDLVHQAERVHQSAGSLAQWSEGWAGTRYFTCDNFSPGTPNNSRDVRLIEEVQLTVGGNEAPYLEVTEHFNGWTIPPVWSTRNNVPYAIFQKGSSETSGNVVDPHPVRLLFISVSKAGTRRPDPLNAPFVEFPWGFTSSLPLPLNPVNPSITIQGVTVSLQWQIVTQDQRDTTIHHFNIYRERAGVGTNYLGKYYHTPGRPIIPYHTTLADQANNYTGIYTFVDRNFDIDPESETYDFNASFPGKYWYFITSVNVEGNENPVSYAGTVDTYNINGHQVFIWDEGDYFQHTYVGQYVTVSGSEYLVTDVSDRQTMYVDPEPSVMSFVSYTIGCVVTTGYLAGNTGGESDPSIYRDNQWNRLYNSGFYIESTGSSDQSLTIEQGTAYTSTLLTSDYQIPWNNWNSNYKEGSSRQLGSGHEGDHDDAFSVWEYVVSGSPTPPVPKFRNPSGAAGAYNGEILLDCGTGDYSTSYIEQFIDKNKFLQSENLVMTAYLRSITSSGTPAGWVRFALYFVDSPTTDFYIRWSSYLDYACSAITSENQRFSMVFKLPSYNANGHNLDGVYNFSGGVGTYVSGDDFADSDKILTPIGNAVLIDGSSGYSITGLNYTPTRITVSPSPTAGNRNVSLNYEYTHVWIYYALFWQPNDHMTVAISKPMINGGKLPANYTQVMNSEDLPGGSHGEPPIDPIPPHCITSDTEILTPYGPRFAKEITKGQQVFSWTKAGRVTNTVEKIVVTQTRELLHFVSGGTHLFCTERHRIAILSDGDITYKKAGDVEVGETMVFCTAFAMADASLEMREKLYLSEPITVYDFGLRRSPHNYVASGLLCHNKQTYQEWE